jgi:hypothetical protein
VRSIKGRKATPDDDKRALCDTLTGQLMWETASRRCGPDFFAEHTLTDSRAGAPDDGADLEKYGV